MATWEIKSKKFKREREYSGGSKVKYFVTVKMYGIGDDEKSPAHYKVMVFRRENTEVYSRTGLDAKAANKLFTKLSGEAKNGKYDESYGKD
jgi:hypothetical protein